MMPTLTVLVIGGLLGGGGLITAALIGDGTGRGEHAAGRNQHGFDWQEQLTPVRVLHHEYPLDRDPFEALPGDVPGPERGGAPPAYPPPHAGAPIRPDAGPGAHLVTHEDTALWAGHADTIPGLKLDYDPAPPLAWVIANMDHAEVA